MVRVRPAPPRGWLQKAATSASTRSSVVIAVTSSDDDSTPGSADGGGGVALDMPRRRRKKTKSKEQTAMQSTNEAAWCSAVSQRQSLPVGAKQQRQRPERRASSRARAGARQTTNALLGQRNVQIESLQPPLQFCSCTCIPSPAHPSIPTYLPLATRLPVRICCDLLLVFLLQPTAVKKSFIPLSTPPAASPAPLPEMRACMVLAFVALLACATTLVQAQVRSVQTGRLAHCAAAEQPPSDLMPPPPFPLLPACFICF